MSWARNYIIKPDFTFTSDEIFAQFCKIILKRRCNRNTNVWSVKCKLSKTVVVRTGFMGQSSEKYFKIGIEMRGTFCNNFPRPTEKTLGSGKTFVGSIVHFWCILITYLTFWRVRSAKDGDKSIVTIWRDSYFGKVRRLKRNDWGIRRSTTFSPTPSLKISATQKAKT